MSSEMVERVARAIALWRHGGETNWEHFEDHAKIAIAAMREPTNEMLRTYQVERTQEIKAIWQNMIDEALK